MADIDQIIAGGAGASTRADFSGIGKFADAYWKGKDQAYQQEGRDLFKNGVPTNADGQPDFAAMGKALFQHGDVGQGTEAYKIDLSRKNLAASQDFNSKAFPVQGETAPIVSPPSANRTASTPVAPPLAKGGVSQPDSSAPTGGSTLMQVLAAQNIPNNQLGAATASIGRQLGLEDPNAPIDVNDPRVRNVLVPAVQQLKRMGIGQPAQPGQPAVQEIPPVQSAPQPQPIPQQPPPTFADRFAAAGPSRPDPTLNGLVPTGRTPEQQVNLLSRAIGSGSLSKEQAAVYQSHIDAINKAREPTPDMKNAAASGQSLTDYQNRGDENTTKRDILTKSLLPKVDKSQETASAARDDIDSIHRSRQQLDAPGGVFSGSFAEQKQTLSKVASALGISDTDKIANTEAYGAAIGQRVASMVKAFGSGTAISDGDRRFASAMAGGNITLDERSMRRILDIGEVAARGKIDQHNKLVDKIVGADDSLKDARTAYLVQAPGEYQKQKTMVDHVGMAKAAIAKGAPRDAVLKRLKDGGYDIKGI